MHINSKKVTDHFVRLAPQKITNLLSKRILVVGCDGVDLWGAVFVKQGKSLSMLAHGNISLMIEGHHLATLLAVLKDQLKQKGFGALPKKALFSTVEFTSMTVEMPIPTELENQKESSQQQAVEEMFRWEMEPVLSQRQSLWSLGNVFVAYQWLDRSELKNLINEQRLQKANLGESESIGALAVRSALIEERQLEHALRFQRRVRQTDEDVSCAWKEIDDVVTSNHQALAAGEADAPFEDDEVDEGSGGQRRWLAGGVYEHHRRFWGKKFSDQGVELVSMHPLVGGSIGCASELNGKHFLLEVYSGLVSCSEFKGGHLKSLRVDHGLDQESAAQCLELLQEVDFEGHTSLELKGNISSLPEFARYLANELQHALDISRCDVVEENDLLIEEHARFSSLATLAKSEFRMPGADTQLTHSTRPVLEAMTQRIGVWWAGVVGVLLLLMISVETLNYVQLLKLETEDALAKSSIEERESIIEKVSHTNGEVGGIKQTLKTTLETRQRLEKKRGLFLDQVDKRQHFVSGILPLLSISLPSDVLLNRVTDRDGIIAVQGWSMSDASAQKFVTGLSAPLAKYDLVTVNESITPQGGPFGKPGQRVVFEISDVAVASPNSTVGLRQ